MADCRIPLLPRDEAEAVAREAGVPGGFAALHIFRLLLRRPKSARAVADLLVSLLFGGALDDRLRELAILRIGWVSGSDYEWTQHWSLAQERFGLSREELLAVREWRSAECFDARDRAVLAATDETLETGTISSETWAACEREIADPDARVELVLALGTWRLISLLTRSLEIPLEEGISSWPPDGLPGPAAR
ncbi:MAG: carboxymuconolactone decarboxylase family protein [Myxococcota bacterium]